MVSIFFFASKPLVLYKYTSLEFLNHDLALLFIRVPVILKVSIELGSYRNLNNTFDYPLQSVYLKIKLRYTLSQKQYNETMQHFSTGWFTISKTELDYQYNKFCTQVA